MTTLIRLMVALIALQSTNILADCGTDGEPGKVYAGCPPMAPARPVGQFPSSSKSPSSSSTKSPLNGTNALPDSNNYQNCNNKCTSATGPYADELSQTYAACRLMPEDSQARGTCLSKAMRDVSKKCSQLCMRNIKPAGHEPLELDVVKARDLPEEFRNNAKQPSRPSSSGGSRD